jgi:O-antigen/teichoic acid export membrane protein
VVRRSSLHSNIVFNLLGAAAPFCVSVIVIPSYLSRVGQSRYGVIALIWLLFGYFGLFDLGLSRATANFLARSENESAARQSEIFWTASITNCLLGIAGGVIFLFAGYYLLTYFIGIPIELKSELRQAMPWVACLLPLSTTGAVFIGALEAHERFLELNLIQVMAAILAQLAPLTAVIEFGPSIAIAISATVLARLLTTLPVFIIAARQCATGSPPTFGRETVRNLFKYGGWITVTNIVGPILTSADQFMIGALAGVAAVPRYSIPFGIATKILLVPAAMTRAIFPQLSRADATVARQRAETVTRTVSLSIVMICAPLIVLIAHLLTLWLGPDFSSQASGVSRIILLGVWINGVAYVPYTLLQSQGRPDAVAKLHLIELVPFLGILWLGLHFYGLIGAALAWSLRVLVDAIFLLRAADFSRKAALALAPSAAFLVASLGISVVLARDPIPSMIGALAVLVTIAGYSFVSDPAFANAYSKIRRAKIS